MRAPTAFRLVTLRTRPRRPTIRIHPIHRLWRHQYDNNATITAAPGVGIDAFNYGVGNISVSNAGTHYGHRRGPTIPGTTQTQYGISRLQLRVRQHGRDHRTWLVHHFGGSRDERRKSGIGGCCGGGEHRYGRRARDRSIQAQILTIRAARPAGILAGFNPETCRRVQRQCFR